MPPEDIEIAVALGRLNQRFDEQDRHLIAIRTQVELTNGRVTILELGNAVREGARQERERVTEDQRRRRAEVLARHGWIRPTLVGALAAGIVSGALKLLGM